MFAIWTELVELFWPEFGGGHGSEFCRNSSGGEGLADARYRGIFSDTKPPGSIKSDTRSYIVINLDLSEWTLVAYMEPSSAECKTEMQTAIKNVGVAIVLMSTVNGVICRSTRLFHPPTSLNITPT